MTIKEVAQLTGLSHQAIYKRLKSHGVNLAEIKDKTTGQLTAAGEELIGQLFGDIRANNEGKTESSQADDSREESTGKGTKKEPEARESDSSELRNQVAELSAEVEKLRNQVENQKSQIEALSGERDYLRLALERSQHLEAAALQRVPALPPTEEERGKLKTWWDRLRGRG